MKKLTIEEKAARYDEVIETFDVILNLNTVKKSGTIFTDDVRKILPELKESEDDVMRKVLINIVKGACSKYGIKYQGDKISEDKILSWLEKQGEKSVDKLKVSDELYEHIRNTCACIDDALSSETLVDVTDYLSMAEHSAQSAFDMIEKQGEQKLTDKVEPKFKVGDWIMSNVSHEDYRICKILKIENGEYVIESIYGYKGHNNFETFDKDYHLWTIQDAKPGDVLADTFFNSSDNPLIFILKDFKHTKHEFAILSDYHSFCFLKASKRQEFCMGSWHNEHNLTPATKEQCDLLFQKMKEAGYEWDAEKKELKNIVTPIFKIGDRVRYKGHACDGVITEITDTDYVCGDAQIPISTQDELELVEQKSADEEMKCLLQPDDKVKADATKAAMEAVIKDKESAIKFLKSAGIINDNGTLAKEYVADNIEQNPAWSEEDEKMIARCIDIFEKILKSSYVYAYTKDCLSWLNSIKERYTWKPSDEQIDALYTYIYNPQYFNSQDPRMELVESVYKDLKKLREE